jgi:hypothetical protein
MSFAISPAVTLALRDVAETYVVTRSVLPNNTLDDGVKFVPVTVSVKAGPPTNAVVGLTLFTVGAGGAVTTSNTEFEVSLGPLVTPTLAIAALAIALAGTAAVTDVAETYVVASAVLP